MAELASLTRLHWPEPRRASCSTGVSMNGPNELGIHVVRKDVLVPEPWDILVKPLDVRHATAENNYVWIQDVDHMSQASRQSVLVSTETCFGRHIICFR
jgi:hypothetical protein